MCNLFFTYDHQTLQSFQFSLTKRRSCALQKVTIVISKPVEILTLKNQELSVLNQAQYSTNVSAFLLNIIIVLGSLIFL